MAAAAREGPVSRRTAALVASAAFHAALVLLAARYLGEAPQVPAAPTITAYLVPLARREPPAQRRERDEERPRADAPSVTPLTAPPQPASPVLAAPPPGQDLDASGRRVLRGLTGCSPAVLPRLSAAERERCEQKFAAAPPGGERSARLNLDTSGRYVEDPEPYLVRRPKDGCKVRATGDTHPMGESGHGRAGVTCVIPF